MYTTCGYKYLIDALSITERVVGKKESLPVLSCVLIEAKKNVCILKATNLESGVEVTIPSKTEKEGIVAVPSHVLTQVLRSSQEEAITLSIEGSSLVVKSKNGTHSLKTVSHDEFPIIPKNKDDKNITIQKTTLSEGISGVSYAASISTIRPEFASICVQYKDEEIIFAATDSFRLAEKKLKNNTKNQNFDVLLPTKNALEILFILDKVSNEEISLSIDDGQFSIHNENIYYVSRITDATFPQYTAIIPKEFTTEVTLLKQDIISVLKKARIFSHTNQQVGFHVYPQKKIVSITAQHQDIGDMADSLDAVVKGEDIDINFNITYISDCFSSIQADSVTLQFAGSGKPLVIKGVGDPTYRYLVMPLNR